MPMQTSCPLRELVEAGNYIRRARHVVR